MTEMIEIAPGIRLPADALRISFARSGGPGGQNVNKLSTKAELRVAVGALASALNERALARFRQLARGRITRQDELRLSAQDERSQEANRQIVLNKLAELIRAARVEPKIRRPTKPSRAARRRRLDEKRRRGQIKSSRRSQED